MITIPSMPTRFRPLPELEIYLETPQLRELAGALERAVWCGMNRDRGESDRFCVYLYHYLGEDDVTDEELTTIRQTWAAHIARSIYEQIGA